MYHIKSNTFRFTSCRSLDRTIGRKIYISQKLNNEKEKSNYFLVNRNATVNQITLIDVDGDKYLQYSRKI
jgi:hypothetical protein